MQGQKWKIIEQNLSFQIGPGGFVTLQMKYLWAVILRVSYSHLTPDVQNLMNYHSKYWDKPPIGMATLLYHGITSLFYRGI